MFADACTAEANCDIIVSYIIQERLATLRWLMTSPAIARPNCLNMSARQRPSLSASPPWVSITTTVRKGQIRLQYLHFDEILVGFFTLEEYQAIVESMFPFSWRIGVSWHCARSTRLCSQVLHWRGQLGPDWQQHPHFLHQGCPVGECEAWKRYSLCHNHTGHVKHVKRGSYALCSSRPSSTRRSGTPKPTWKTLTWCGTSGAWGRRVCIRYLLPTSNPLLNTHISQVRAG